MQDVGVRERADITALASRQERAIAVLVWNYHDDDLAAPPAVVTLTIAGVPAANALVTHYRVDRERSNTYEVWKKWGRRRRRRSAAAGGARRSRRAAGPVAPAIGRCDPGQDRSNVRPATAGRVSC